VKGGSQQMGTLSHADQAQAGGRRGVKTRTIVGLLRACWTWPAAVKLALPAWLASMTQVPTPVKVTAPVADTVQAPEVEEASAEKTTGLPDAPPVALAV